MDTEPSAQQQLEACTQVLRARLQAQNWGVAPSLAPPLVIVLGSGLSSLSEAVVPELVVPYQELPGFPVSTAPGHQGRFIFGHVMAPQLSRRAGGQAPAPAAQHPVVLMQGRVHYYEGYSTEEVVLPLRVLACLGARGVVLTNAAGGLRAEFHPGDLMLLRDHIASFVPSPLRGPNLSELGPRFPDMTCVYDERLRALLKEAAAGLSLLLPEGVYLQVGGPQFETPAEIEVYRLLGADATGMSTAVEAIAAHHAGMRVAGISCITNLAAGMSGQPLSSEEVEEVGQQAATHFAELLVTAIPALVAELGSEGAGAR